MEKVRELEEYIQAGFFRQLNCKEESEPFKQWARDNYKPLNEVKLLWHPVTQRECYKMNVEALNDLV